MAEPAKNGLAYREHQRMVVRREDLIKLFSLGQLFAEIGKRLDVVENHGKFEASPVLVSKLVELRNLPEE